MNRLNNNEQFKQLRETYPFFSFEKYSIHQGKNQLELTFTFNLSNMYYFYPKMIIPLQNPIYEDQLSDIEQLAFHIGMIELISYWKSTCSPKVTIKPFSLSHDQILWWKNLYFNGLGEFFYINGIDTSTDKFMTLEAHSGTPTTKSDLKLKDEILLPVGGGKDSIVSIELLKKQPLSILPFQLNAMPARTSTILNAGFELKNSITITRIIHSELIKLNKSGFLNGHTPFSALLAFTSLLVAYLYQKRHIVLSNESSANEPSIIGTNINHQYSKSFAFERNFRDYTQKYISEEFNYFSFLRPLNELQIAMLFAKFPQHFKDFRSCNAGSKENNWCRDCSKCLFVYIILAPFIKETQLKAIFGGNLFEERSLIPLFNELIGHKDTKPFECVGTIEDVNIAIQLFIKTQYQGRLLFLIEHYKSLATKTYSDQEIKSYLKKLNNQHHLSASFFKILEENI